MNAFKAALDDGSKIFFRKVIVAQSESQLPPRLRTYPPRTRMTLLQIEEMKGLRTADPETNTVSVLAKRYNTFPGFVLKHTICPAERKQRLTFNAEKEFELLPLSKKKRAIDRLRRKELW